MIDTMSMASFGGFWRMASKYWRMGFEEYYRSWSKHAFTVALQKLLPELGERDIRAGGSGVRAQALEKTGALVDDFRFVYQDRILHVCNVPSPAATASLVIGKEIVSALKNAKN
jgi:L-2-hydroxyglutarate oxidase LhgO